MIKLRTAASPASAAPGPNGGRNAASIRREKLREQFWPGSASEIWDRKKENGFSTIPRTLGLIMTLIDELADRDKGKDVARVYFELWCRNFDEAFIEIADEEAMAFASGFTAPNRNVRTWKERIDVLQKLGFIQVMPVGSKKHGYIFSSRSSQGHQEAWDSIAMFSLSTAAVSTRLLLRSGIATSDTTHCSTSFPKAARPI